MHRERVSENVYWFQSEIYAQVTAGVVAGPGWAVVIDTLALPDETQAMRNFIDEEINVPVRYIINTHYHADHTWGNCYFPAATVIAHKYCREIMLDRGQSALDSAKKQNPSLQQVKIIPPHITFEKGQLTLRVGKKNLVLFPTPGNTIDGISVLIEEDRILFAGDVFMPIPFIVDGDIDDMTTSIKKIGKMGLENIVQGHGDIILRGEIDEAVRENLAYLAALRKAVRTALRRKNPLEYLDSVGVESCGKSRVNLGGLAEELHSRNINVLYQQLSEVQPNGEEKI